MIDPVLKQVLWTTFSYAACGCLVGVATRLVNRSQPGPRLDQAAAVGALIGAAFGAFVGIFQSMLLR